MGFPIYFLRPSVFHVLTYTYKLEIKISPLARRLLDTFKSNYLSIKFKNLLIDAIGLLFVYYCEMNSIELVEESFHASILHKIYICKITAKMI